MISADLEDQPAIVELQNYIPQTSSTGIEQNVNPFIEGPTATCSHKLKPLAIPEQGLPVLGLLTPVEETPDDAQASSSKAVRRLPIPSRRIDLNRPRAQSWTNRSAPSHPTPTFFPTESDAIQTITNNPISQTTIVERPAFGPGYHSGARDVLSSPRNDPFPKQRSAYSRTGPREARSLTVSYPTNTESVLSGRISTPKSPHISPLTPPEHRIVPRTRANSNVATPRHQIQHWNATSDAAPNASTNSGSLVDADAIEIQSPRFHNAKVKALPRPPTVLENSTETQMISGNRLHITTKDKGKGRAIEFTEQTVSQNNHQCDNTTDYGLLTPPDSSINMCPPASNAIALSGLRRVRPRGPRFRRSTIC
ncbi:hypothetical protein J3R30DRAFT_3693462 [Lentinula aciculospora]|uniref:Uncharacterized protein n=1 Tax=Lentinula aciculospora TaxID=153920 RepID=A0A9W9AT80_9AGAR|nr:hypothetical protein J3R30DRAFT_3693462 [Lentinula aciculospora]